MKNQTGTTEVDLWEQEVAGENAVQRLYALTRYRFRELQETEAFSQQQLADRMGLTRSQISRWFANPSNMTLRSAAKVLMAMGRKLELGVSDPYAVARSADEPERVPAPVTRTATVLRFPEPRGAAARLKFEMAADTGGARGAGHAVPDPEPMMEIGRLDSEAGPLHLWAWRSIVFAQLPGDAMATRLSLGDKGFDMVPADGGLHFVGGLSVADAAMFAERHRDDPESHPVRWRP